MQSSIDKSVKDRTSFIRASINIFSFSQMRKIQSVAEHLKTSDQSLKLGDLLLKKGVLTNSQLKEALHFQVINKVRLGEALISLSFVTPSMLNRALFKQSWLKVMTTIGAFIFAPIASNACFAAENQKVNTIKVANIDKSHSPFKRNMQASLSPISIDEQSKAYYFSGHESNANGASRFFVLGRKFSERSGLSLSLFSKAENRTQINDWKIVRENINSNKAPEINYLSFDPQISLFKYSIKPSKFSFNKRRIYDANRYTNTIPAVIMLTLKGRSIYESAGDQTRIWSLDRAKKGVQRKAQLMLSITKQF